MAWRVSSRTLLEKFGFEEDGNQTVDQELGEKQLHLKPGKKRCRVRPRRFSLSVFSLAGCFSPFSRRLKLQTAGYIAVGDAKKEKPSLQQEFQLKLAACDNIAEVERKMNQPRLQELQEQSPCIQAQLRMEINSGGRFTIRSGFQSVLKWSASVVRCFFCMSRHLTLASEVDMEGNETNLDHVTYNDELGVIWLSGVNHSEEIVDVSILRNRVGDDSVDFIATDVQRIDRNATLDVVNLSVAPSTEHPLECGVGAEDIITVNLGGPGEPSEVLRGLSLMGYERVVFFVCPPLPAVEADF